MNKYDVAMDEHEVMIDRYIEQAFSDLREEFPLIKLECINHLKFPFNGQQGVIRIYFYLEFGKEIMGLRYQLPYPWELRKFKEDMMHGFLSHKLKLKDMFLDSYKDFLNHQYEVGNKLVSKIKEK